MAGDPVRQAAFLKMDSGDGWHSDPTEGHVLNTTVAKTINVRIILHSTESYSEKSFEKKWSIL